VTAETIAARRRLLAFPTGIEIYIEEHGFAGLLIGEELHRQNGAP